MAKDNAEFLRRFYGAKDVSQKESSLGQASLVQAASGQSASRQAFSGQVLGEEPGNKEKADFRDDFSDFFEEETEAYRLKEKKKLSQRTRVSLFLLLLLIPATVALGVFLWKNQGGADDWIHVIFGNRAYYIISLLLVVYATIPFFMVFEGRKPQARELIVLATLAALACAGRGAFFMVPNFKPVIAIVIVSGIAFGGEAGFLVGSMTMLVSNFLFGQGPWTPWQMFAMGFIGFLSGILYQKGWLATKRWTLSLYGFLVTIFIYGGIMNPAALFMSVYDFTWAGLLAIYISGIPVDLVHATSTFLFLWFGAKPLLDKLQRIKIKYGLIV